ncbi:phage integrase SAM-like domain-containing protein [Chryseobacterium viscerum]|uniref:Integrase n=1 Tax=Chryseobacterium viscerum TaxID=1037377 RepID=A0A316WAV8_9FLAO|nr:phage integrase SAM-like domain-containing protein [Chryseobacterium viscerum]PWN58079.1 integrase [Chryseobacterium viscerum]
MTFNFSLTHSGASKNIKLKIIDTKTGIRYDFHTPLRIKKEHWDDDKQRPVNIYIKKYKKINYLLDKVRIKITSYINEKRSKSRPITHRSLYRQIFKICNDDEKKLTEGSLLYYIEQYITQRSELICESTRKRYQVFFNLIQRFEGYIKKNLQIGQVDADFVRNFMVFGKEELYSENTLYRTIHFVKTILNFAERKGIRTCIREIELKREKQSREIITLNETEIKKIKKMTIPEELKDARDWLIISCYTGQRYSDFINFSTDNILEIKGKSCIRFVQKKTKKEITLPLHPAVIDIIKQYHNTFPKNIELNEYNKKIRKIALIAEIQTTIRVRKRIGHRVKSILIEKWQAITSHIGRRSFATNFYSKIPTSLLIAATGHSTENMFLKYINPVDDERIVNLSNYFEKLNIQEAMVI